MDWLRDPQAWIGFVTLAVLEIVLGIDNLIFISILVGKLPARDQPLARRLGLGLAMLGRIGLLLSLSWVVRLTNPLFSVAGQEISGRDLVLIVGGLFLLAKSTAAPPAGSLPPSRASSSRSCSSISSSRWTP